jgi:surface protein
MFASATAFNANIGSWDTARATNMQGLAAGYFGDRARSVQFAARFPCQRCSGIHLNWRACASDRH